MENRKLKKEVVYGIYAALLLLLLSILYYADLSNKSLSKIKEKEKYTYVSKLFDTGVKSVVSTPTTIVLRPYNNTNVKILKSFYDYKGEEKSQENSIINYDTTYMQNNGTIYGGIDEKFDVISVLDGKITSIKDDALLGKVVTIEHENNITTTYESLSEVTVKEGDQIAQGTVIGTAGESNLQKDLGNHLLFEITVDGKYQNPENCFDKQVNDLKNN